MENQKVSFWKSFSVHIYDEAVSKRHAENYASLQSPALEAKYHLWPFFKIQFDSRPAPSKEYEA